MKKLFLGTLAGLLWVLATGLILCPFEVWQGILHALVCVFAGVALFGAGCTAAMLASGKEVRTHGEKDL